VEPLMNEWMNEWTFYNLRKTLPCVLMFYAI
jgi:hypothetical protein